jgi:hypothetical protein
MVQAHPSVFRHGPNPLPAGSTPLRPEGWKACHIQHCVVCGPAGDIVESCYFHSMYCCLTHGWAPEVDVEAIQPPYVVHGNAKSAEAFSPSLQKALAKQVASGALVVVPVALGADPRFQGVVSPLGAILKSSDKAAAFAHTGVVIKDQDSLELANGALLTMGLAPIKVRGIMNLAASGVNGATKPAPFRNPTVDNALELVSPGCVMVKTDFEGFFPHFPFAICSQWLFLACFLGVLYRAARCVFGFALCPVYCCAFAAEVAAWLNKEFPVSHYCDDFFATSDPSAATYALALASAQYRLARMLSVFASVGLAVAADKTAIGQRLLVLGLMVDSVSMTVSCDPVSALAYAAELRLHIATLAGGRRLTSAVLARMGGKLTSYCQAAPAGLLRIRLVYAHLVAESSFSAAGMAGLIKDLEWWLVRLDDWAISKQRPDATPLLSPAALCADPAAVEVLVSDASGPDGYGGYAGPLGCANPAFFAVQWTDPAAQFTSSAQGELQGLAHHVASLRASPRPSLKLLIWVTDSQAASGMVNKGTSRSHPCYALLCQLLDSAEALGVQVVSLWWPREEGAYADFLSHLAVSLNVSSVSGRLSDVDALITAKIQCSAGSPSISTAGEN